MTDASAAPAPISPDLLELLACPLDQSGVQLDGDVLVCTECGRRYPIENGVPNMLVDEDV